MLPATGYRLLATLPLLACLYIPFIGGGLLTDDFAHVNRLTHLDSAIRILDSPDTFGFYRPVTQASMAVSPGARGQRPAQARAVNAALHGAVIVMAFVVARLVLSSPLAAGLATLAFALTPKAHPIAVLWISARGELLMALFSLASVAAWIAWTRRGRWIWLAAAGIAYALAVMSKETATLLPLLLLVTPRPERSLAQRAAAAAALVGVAVAIYAWRSQTGALTPFSGDTHYDLMVPLARSARSAINYAGRMLIAPLALVAALGLAAIARMRSSPDEPRAGLPRVAVFSLAWIVLFLAPILPIVLRSELYLYLPVFGLCLLAGWMAAALARRSNRRAVAITIGVYAIALAGYQLARASEIHRNLLFSERLVAALQKSDDLAGRSGRMLLVPSDSTTERFLQDAIGGYLYFVLEHAVPGAQLAGAAQYRGEPPHQADLRLVCAYRQDQGLVIISPAP